MIYQSRSPIVTPTKHISILTECRKQIPATTLPRFKQYFFSGGSTRRIKSVVSLVYFMMPKFPGYRKKYIKHKVRRLKVRTRGRVCILIVVRTHMDYLFRTENENEICFLLSTVLISFYLLNFEFPLIMTEVVRFQIIMRVK